MILLLLEEVTCVPGALGARWYNVKKKGLIVFLVYVFWVNCNVSK